MPVYAGEQADFFKSAMESMLEQSIPPTEFVLVCDGPLTEALESVIDELSKEYAGQTSFQLIRFQEHQGIGIVLAAGVEACANELIARMDSDDIADKERCALQLAAFEADEELALCSGSIAEFRDDPLKSETLRRLPLDYNEILNYARRRNPMNHMAVMARRSAILRSGNYQDIHGAEDYELWVRMLCSGEKACNLPETLVYARIGNGMIERRGGMRYVRDALRLQKRFLRMGFLTRMGYFTNCLIRIAVGISPKFLRAYFYQRQLRDQVKPSTKISVKGNNFKSGKQW